MKKVIVLILSLHCIVAFAQKIHFAHVTDTHIGGQTGASDLEKTIWDINSQKDIDFVLLTGDITEFGSNEELLQAKKIIDRFSYF